MEQIVKAFLVIFLMILFTFVGVGVISATVDSSAAEQYTADAAAQIEQYNFSDAVIAACQSNASVQGYEMMVTKIDSDGDGFTDMAEIRMKYDYSIPLLNIGKQEHYARAYAR